jgi:UDP-N-acetylmuramyl pentapeptide phosphotransferase/UDP-N-acetylglucosamine-1-phosphate transferase
VYFLIADNFDIIDKPNHRSSHSLITIRGGGIIIPVVFIVYELINYMPDPFFIAGLIIISVVSFIDDVKGLPSGYRLAAQMTAVMLMLFDGGITSFILGVLMLIIITGFINGYNFMDGINGITGVYSLIITLTLFVVNDFVFQFIDNKIFIYLIIPVFVFLFYNFRVKAKCFAGDVGSVSLAFIISFMMLLLIIKSGNLFYLFFVAVYGIDIVFTIIQRLLLKQNILEAHRMHLYQILANEAGLSHKSVTLLYGMLQLLINSIVIVITLSDLTSVEKWIVCGLLLVLLIVLYLIVKRRLMIRYNIGFKK